MQYFYPWLRRAALLAGATLAAACARHPEQPAPAATAGVASADAAASCGGTTRALTINGVAVNRLNDKPNVYYFTSGIKIDSDGSPYSYHPSNDAIALDYLGNSTTDSRKYVQGRNGVPVWRGARGYYVSQTSLGDPSYPESDPRRWVDAESIPFIVIPREMYRNLSGVRPGNLGYAYNKRTGRGCFAICAETGPANSPGEGSINLAQQLGVTNTSPKNGGQAGDIVYIILANSGNGRARTVPQIYNEGAAWLANQGGNDVLACLNAKPASFPLLSITERNPLQSIVAGTPVTFDVLAGASIKRVKITIDGQYVIRDAALDNAATATVPYEQVFNTRGIRNLVIEGFDADNKVLTAVSRRLQVF